jgi:hypothetical protein
MAFAVNDVHEVRRSSPTAFDKHVDDAALMATVGAASRLPHIASHRRFIVTAVDNGNRQSAGDKKPTHGQPIHKGPPDKGSYMQVRR